MIEKPSSAGASQSAATAYDCRNGAGMSKQKVNILYCRLSRDDGDGDRESNSISNQKNILIDYAEKNGFTPYIVAVDDGYSGTNYNRPGWQELMGKVENDEVSAVIIKNLDRMGRNYLQTGMYRERFQDCGVRLIAVHDGIDTAVGDGDDFLPFREIMAEYYARDASRKIKAVLHAKSKLGKPLSNIPPYGYVKDTNDKNKWLVDPVAAAVVKRIFGMTIDGIGPQSIAGILTREQIIRPSRHSGFPRIGHNLGTDDETDYSNRFTWVAATVANILSRIEYLGHTVNMRTTMENFKTKKQRKNPQEEWQIFYHTHEAIITQKEFDLVQKLRETPRRIDHLGEANPLTGILFCADCGAKLHNHRNAKATQHRKKPIDVYRCSTYLHASRRFEKKCSAHHIGTDAVRNIILDALKHTAGYVREYESEFVERIRELSAVKQGEAAKIHKKQIAKNERRLAEIDRICKSLYEDKALGKISEEMYNEMADGYQQERLDLRAKTDELQSALNDYINDGERAGKFIEIARRHTNLDELTPAILNECIDKVIVHEGKWSDGHTGKGGRPRGSRSQQVDVYLKYIGKFDVPDLRSAEEIEAEHIAWEKAEQQRKINRERMREIKAAQRADEETGNPKPAA